jgi:exportin-1
VQLQSFADSLSQNYSNVNQFKSSLRDFLIQLKEFSNDYGDLFLEEREAAAQKRMQEEYEAAMRIPGMLKPSQMEEKDGEVI